MTAQDFATAPLSGGRQIVGTSDGQQTYLVETSNGRCIRLSATAYHVLTRIDRGVAAAEVAHELSHRLGRDVTAAHVEAAYAHVRQQVDAIAQRSSRPKPFGLWFRVRLLPISAVGWLSRQLSRLLHPAAAVPLTLLILAAIPVLAAGGSGHHNMMDPGAAFLPVLVLFMISMLAHELGHASASVRYGAPARGASVAGLVRDLSDPPHTPASGRVSSILGPTYVLFGVTMAFFRLSRRLVYAVRPAVAARRTRGPAAS